MHLQRLVAIISSFMVMTAAQPLCDPLTEYEHNGKCCKMCGPGTSMTSLSTCLEPQCQECEKDEYQAQYTRESMCPRQPYCDPNRNFQVPVHDITKKTICVCKEGFHCSTQDCMTCVPHTTCKPGYEVLTKGSHLEDTVCRKCSKGTFSNESPWTGVCKKWTECENGQYVIQGGTDTSDNICATSPRSHVFLIVVIMLIFLALLVVLVAIWLIRDKQRGANRKVKYCIESCVGETQETIPRLAVMTPTDPGPDSLLTEQLPSLEEQRTPVEVDDDESEEMLTSRGACLPLTDNGNLLTQEIGKTEKLSRQESQTQSSISQ